MSCSYVIVACAFIHVDPHSYEDHVYKLENVFNMYNKLFNRCGICRQEGHLRNKYPYCPTNQRKME
ncbi:hypothetical protein CR513_50416, partial [Mucuna pruriens]